MTRMEALMMVIELARQNILSEREAHENDMEDEREKQKQACDAMDEVVEFCHEGPGSDYWQELV